MSAQKKEQDIENLLVPESTEAVLKRISIQELEMADSMEISDDEAIFFNEDGTMGRKVKATRKLEGAELMRFLNLPERQYNRLRKGDLSRIRWKFKDLFEKWIRENKPGRNETALFWNQMRIKVWNKANAGKMTRGCAAVGLEPSMYNGDIMLGEALKTHLPETRRTNSEDDYILVLLSMTVTEELENV